MGKVQIRVEIKRLVELEVLIQPLYPRKSEKVQLWNVLTVKKYPSEGLFYRPLLCESNWTSHLTDIIQRLLNLKGESGGFVRAVGKTHQRDGWLLSLIPGTSHTNTKILHTSSGETCPHTRILFHCFTSRCGAAMILYLTSWYRVTVSVPVWSSVIADRSPRGYKRCLSTLLCVVWARCTPDISSRRATEIYSAV